MHLQEFKLGDFDYISKVHKYLHINGFGYQNKIDQLIHVPVFTPLFKVTSCDIYFWENFVQLFKASKSFFWLKKTSGYGNVIERIPTRSNNYIF